MLRGYNIMGDWDGISDAPLGPVPEPLPYGPTYYDQQAREADVNDTFWKGNSTSSATDAPMVESGWSIPDAGMPLTPEQSQAAAAKLALDTAASGGSVSPEVVQMWQRQGIDLNALTTAAGAVFKYVQQPGGKYVAQPQNAAAQQAMARSKQLNTMLLAGAGLLAFLLLR